MPEVPLLQETRDPSMGSKENSPSLPTPGTANLGENGTVNGVNNAGMWFLNAPIAGCPHALQSCI